MSGVRLFGGMIIAATLALAPMEMAGQTGPATPRVSVAPSGPVGAGITQAVGGDDVATILLIDDNDITRPIFQRALENIRDVLNARTSQRALLHVETLGMHLANSAERGRRIMARIADEYAQEPLDLLIAIGDSSVSAAMQLRARWGRDIPIIGLYTTSELLQPGASIPSLPNGVQVRLGDFNSATARNIQVLIPSLSEVVIVGSSTNDVNGAAASMRAVLGNRVKVEGIVAPSHGELAQRFALLSKHSAIMYLSVGRDSQGRTWQVREYLRKLLEIAPRPVFAWLGTYVGLGIVGGPVLDGSEAGAALGRLAVEVLGGTDPSAIAPVVLDEARVVYDWVPLRQFGIPLSRLPEGATVLNRPLPVWESYPRTSIAVSALIVVLFVSIGILVHSRRRVREANAAQLAMSRRLLQTQDEERVRIARDLHDDLCQQMAMLAFDVDGARGGSLAPRAVVDRVHMLIDRTRKIAVGLHATHIGSMPFREAIASHASSVQARTGLDLHVHIASWEHEPAPPVALALFRAVQEALQNAIRHAEATQVTLTMESSNGTVRIEVTDDGIGFEPMTSGNMGLGMTSMRERMATVGGAFTVHSVPFGGTTVTLSAPIRAATAESVAGVVQGVTT